MNARVMFNGFFNNLKLSAFLVICLQSVALADY